MGYSSTKIMKATVGAQPDFVTRNIAGGTTFECEVDLGGISRQVFQRASIRGGWHALDPVQGGYAESTFTAKWMYHGHRGSTPILDPSASVDGLIVAQILGSSVQSGFQAGAQVAAGSDENTVMIGNTKIETLYKAGGAAVFADGAGSHEIGIVNAVTNGGAGDHTVELLLPLSFVPGDAEDTYGCDSVYSAVAAPVFYTWRLQGGDADMNIYLAGACPTSVKLTATAGEPLMVEATFSCADVLVQTGTAAAPYAYSAPVYPAILSGEGGKLIEDSGSTTPTALDWQTFELEMTQTLANIRGHGTASGIRDRHPTNRQQRLTVQKILSAGPDFTLTTENSAKKALGLFTGGSPGNMFGLVMPQPSQQEVASLDDADGLWAQTYIYEPARVTGDTPTSDGPANSPFRVYMG